MPCSSCSASTQGNCRKTLFCIRGPFPIDGLVSVVHGLRIWDQRYSKGIAGVRVLWHTEYHSQCVPHQLPSSVGSIDTDQGLSFSHSTYSFDGILDEVRVSRIAHSAGWILTEYNNQYDPAGFYSVGPECLSPDLENIPKGGSNDGKIDIIDSAWDSIDGTSISVNLNSSGSNLMAIAILGMNNYDYLVEITSVSFNGDPLTNLETAERDDDAHACSANS